METTALLSDLFKTLLGLGPGGLIAAFAIYNWREERSERRELQLSNTKLLEAKIANDSALAVALEHLADKVDTRNAQRS